MLDTKEPAQIAATDRPTPAAKQDPLMAPELALLRDVQMPFNPSSPPNVRLEQNTVVINITTPDSTNSPEWLTAIAHLQARGCTVTVDRESSLDFIHVEITAPASLFSREAIAVLETNRQAEETRAAAARAQSAMGALRREQEVGYGC